MQAIQDLDKELDALEAQKIFLTEKKESWKFFIPKAPKKQIYSKNSSSTIVIKKLLRIPWIVILLK